MQNGLRIPVSQVLSGSALLRSVRILRRGVVCFDLLKPGIRYGTSDDSMIICAQRHEVNYKGQSNLKSCMQRDLHEQAIREKRSGHKG